MTDEAAKAAALSRAFDVGGFRARDEVERKLLRRAGGMPARERIPLLESMWRKGMGCAGEHDQRAALEHVARVLAPVQPTGRDGRLCWAHDVSAAEWVRTGIDWSRVGAAGVLPRCFAAYARILHPAEDARGEPVRWADVAAWSGARLDADTWFEDIATPSRAPGGQPPPWRSDPAYGDVPEDLLNCLTEALVEHTTSPHGWFCLWHGWGWIGGAMMRLSFWAGDGPPPPDSATTGRPSPAFPPEIDDGPKVRMPDFDRTYFLFEGPIDAAADLGGWVDWGGSEREFIRQAPSIWWPDDQAWCVATEVDFEFTYVGGTEQLIDDLLARPDLEVQRTPLIPA